MNLSENFETPVTKELSARGIPYRFFRHEGPVRSLEQAAKERGQRAEQVIRSILFRCSDKKHVMVLVAGPEQISWNALRAYLGVSRITMATEEEVLTQTGYPIGAVSPFGLGKPIRILVDENVFKNEEISIGSGIRFTTVILKSEDLKRALGDFEVGCFVS